jgi:hypothetical protein
MEAKLMSMLLSTNSTSKLSLFLKIRKLILKINKKEGNCLDNILLEHSDIIGILHSAFSSAEIRKKLADGIKALFISFKMVQAK